MTFSTPTNLVSGNSAVALTAASEVPEVASFNVKAGLAQMLKVHPSSFAFGQAPPLLRSTDQKAKNRVEKVSRSGMLTLSIHSFHRAV